MVREDEKQVVMIEGIRRQEECLQRLIGSHPPGRGLHVTMADKVRENIFMKQMAESAKYDRPFSSFK